MVLADEATYEDGVRCVVMPCCGFTFDEAHLDWKTSPDQYTSPCCRPWNEANVTQGAEALAEHFGYDIDAKEEIYDRAYWTSLAAAVLEAASK